MTSAPNLERCWAEIDPGALRHNARVARERVGSGVALLAVIKANGYGHGLAATADALRDDAQLFGVANLREAMETRSVVAHPVVILGPALPEERAAIVENGFIPSVSNFAEAQEFSRAAGPSALSVNCAIDTGMGRMGIAEAEVTAEFQRMRELPNVKIHSVSTHLPVADEDPAYTEAQLQRFEKALAQVRRAAPGEDYLVHALCSAGVSRFANSAFDIVRAGLMLYGASPDPELQRQLRPAMTWKTRIVLLREVAAGSSISYGRTFITPQAMRVATISAGYADGLPRAISNRDAVVLIGGRRCAVLGRVTMDLTMVDVSAVPEAKVGDEVVLMGRQGDEEILATEIAAWASTIAWEIFTGIGSRVARVYG